MSGLKYVRQLQKRWGMRAPRQLYRMMRLHRTSFDTILRNMFEALDDVKGKFAFPTVAAVARMKPDLIRTILNEGHEVASHGYNHVRYPSLTAEGRERDLALSLQTYRKMGVKITGFRAPYDNYTDDMPQLIEKYGLVWDGGFGYRAEHREKTHLFKVQLASGESSTTFIPLNVMSDDLMIDGRGMNPAQVSRALKAEIEKVSQTEGVIMFDLHPIRMGQKRYAPCLRDVVEYAHTRGGWCTTPTEAVTYWNSHGKWKGNSSFCLLLTGDIDNWVFSDYLRRVLWRRG
ncbi:MAG: polysaccharide deacetylase family protein [Candidatus Thorarchaeota archaeon]